MAWLVKMITELEDYLSVYSWRQPVNLVLQEVSVGAWTYD